MAANESYPDDLRYHPEHDWARIEGDEAVLGITWYAQDALGELVHFEAPEAGATITKDGAYAEVESVKAPHGAGVVTSGSLSPCLEIGIGMACVPVEDAVPGTPIEVDVRGKVRGAEVREKPLYRKANSG